MSFWTKLKIWLTPAEKQVEAFVKNVVKSNVAAIVPIAQAAVANLVAAEVAQIAAGNTKDTGHTLADAVKATETAVINAGIKATTGEILTAVGVVKQ